MIATHPHVERRVVAELDALGLLATPARPYPRELAYEDIGKLSFLTNCIKARCACRTHASVETGDWSRLVLSPLWRKRLL